MPNKIHRLRSVRDEQRHSHRIRNSLRRGRGIPAHPIRARQRTSARIRQDASTPKHTCSRRSSTHKRGLQRQDQDADHRQGRTASGPQNGHADGRLRPTEYGHQHHRLSGHHVHFKGRPRNKTDRKDEHRPRRKLERKNHYLHLGIRPIDVARTEGDSSFRRRRNQWRKPVLGSAGVRDALLSGAEGTVYQSK